MSKAKPVQEMTDGQISKRLANVKNRDGITVWYRQSMPGVRQKPMVKSILKIRVADLNNFDDHDPDNDVNPPLHRIFTRSSIQLHHKRVQDPNDSEGFHLIWSVEFHPGEHHDEVWQVYRVEVRKHKKPSKK